MVASVITDCKVAVNQTANQQQNTLLLDLFTFQTNSRQGIY